MRRIIPLTLLALTLSGGVAVADRGWRNDHPGRRPGGVVVRDRGHDHGRVYDPRSQRRGGWRRDRVVRVQRARPVFRDNRFYFPGGFYRAYSRPVINVRYRDYARRPALIVENYDPVPGYTWVQGHWHWSGYEWIWTPGRYEVDPGYQDPYGAQGGYYDGGYYDNGGYVAPQGGYYAPQGGYYAPQGGVSVQGSVSGSWNF